MADLSVEFAGIKFKNPVLAASAEPTLNVKNMRRVIEAGAGGLVAKSVSHDPALRRVFHKWRILNERHEVARGKVPRGFTLYGRGNATELTLEEWLPVLKESKKIADDAGAVLIGSGDGPAVADWVEQAKRIEDIGIQMMECNFGCPHPGSEEGHRKTGQIGQDIDFSTEIIRAIKKEVSIPIVVKCSPQVVDLLEIVRALREAGAAGVTISNRFTGFIVDIQTGKPLLSSWAGVGGPWVKPITLRWISQAHALMPDFPVSGSNGPYDWKDVVEYIMSGATTVQLCSVLLVKGIDYIKDVVAGLNTFLDGKGYQNVRDILGMAVKAALPPAEATKVAPVRARIDEEKCTACGNCIRSCMFAAIQSEDERVWVDDKACVGCEMCFSMCPADAISYVSALV
ncbi:MAG: 4Fe-4S binding protein [Chloroflexota bacterium]|nr:4Fe-4S binding protein [Chloroflexota bacterium]